MARGEQDFTSCEAQHERGEDYIRAMKYEGWTVLDERFDDLGRSGGTLERPALRQLLSWCAQGRVDVVVVTSIDRLARKMAHWVQLQEWLKHAGVQLAILQGAGGATGPLAELERDLIRERQRDARGRARARGLRTAGRAPLGYRADPNTRQLVVDPEEAALVIAFFERCAAGEPGAAAAAWARLGVSVRDAAGGARSAEDIFADVMDRLKAVPDDTTRAAMGFDLLGHGVAELGGVINKGGGGITALRAEAKSLGLVLDADLIERSGKLNDGLDRLRGAFESVRATLAAAFLPVIERIVDRMEAWWRANGEVVKAGLEAFVDGVAQAVLGAIDAFDRWVASTKKLIDDLGGLDRIAAVLKVTLFVLSGAALGQAVASTWAWVTALVAARGGLRMMALDAAQQAAAAIVRVGAAMSWASIRAGVFNASVAALPMLIGAAIALLLLFAEDLYTFFQGGDSLIGAFLDELAAAGGALTLWWQKIKDGAIALFNDLGGALDGWWQSVKDGAGALYDDVTAMASHAANSVFDAFVGAFRRLRERAGAAFGWLGDLADKVGGYLTGGAQAAVETARDTTGGVLRRSGDVSAALSAAAPGARTAAGGNAALNVNGGINVTVAGTTNMRGPDLANAVQRGVNMSLQDQVKNMRGNLAGGVI